MQGTLFPLSNLGTTFLVRELWKAARVVSGQEKKVSEGGESQSFTSVGHLGGFLREVMRLPPRL